MFHKILVCSDGSPCSVDAAETAASIARSTGAEVLALNVFNMVYADPAYFGVWGMTIDNQMLERFAAEQRKAIEPTLTAIFERLNVPFRFLQEAGQEAEVDAILRVAEREKADLIVVGSRGLRGITEVLLGSVSSGVLHHASCPVLIVRGENAPCGTGSFDNIVLASDGSPCSQRAARIAVELAQKLSASLTVLNVYEDLSSATVPGNEDRLVGDMDMEAYAKQWMDYVAEPVRGFAKEAGITCNFVQKGGRPDQTIVDFARQHEVDLIVLGSRGLGGYARMMIGSVSNRVVHHADCPVLVVR